VSRTPREQVIQPRLELDPEIFEAGEEAGKSLARQRANEKRHRDAQLTDEQLKAIAEYYERHRHSKLSAWQSASAFPATK
jgi:hypothetical protein